MQSRSLGSSGLKVSEIGLGCNNFGMRIDRRTAHEVVAAALDAGIDFFDTADVYGGGESEVFLGEALGERRPNVIIATKFGMPTGEGPLCRGGSRRYVSAAIEASLKRLGSDYIDLYQMHTPDRDTPIEETLRALEDAIRAGKVRYVGCSNFAGWQIADAVWCARGAGVNGFVSAQNNYSLLERSVEREVLPACEHLGVGFLPYFPLASGLLTGKYRRGEPPPEDSRLANMGARGERALSDANFDVVERLSAWAARHDWKLLDLAIAWLLARDVISSVIAGATSVEQVQANAAAAGRTLDAVEIDEVNGLTRRPTAA